MLRGAIAKGNPVCHFPILPLYAIYCSSVLMSGLTLSFFEFYDAEVFSDDAEVISDDAEVICKGPSCRSFS